VNPVASAGLDRAFAALADPTRRGILERVGRADATISELADRFEMTRTGVTKHVQVLEGAELVRTRKVGRVRTVAVGPQRLDEVVGWIASYRAAVEARLDRLDGVLEQLQRAEG
jgi:DNA-binding transcriptional ArsR family regulator